MPAYTPERNVVEHCGEYTEYDEMAHCIPHDGTDLAQEVASSLLAKHRRPDLLHAFFRHARLDL